MSWGFNYGLYEYYVPKTCVDCKQQQTESSVGDLSTKKMKLPRKSQGSFTCRKYATWDRRIYFPSEERHAVEFFSPEKIRRLQPGSNPRSWVPEASMLTIITNH
jgi:hypothetical protein